MKHMFKDTLDISDEVITVNACNATDQGFEILKKILKYTASDIIVCKSLFSLSRSSLIFL